MLDFTINQQFCISCGQCAADCPARIILMENGLPGIAPDVEALCYKCQHCLAVCPTGALSILGLKPTGSLPLTGKLPEPDQLALLMKGRRSVRRYKPENLDPALLNRLLEVAWYAPTGVNSRQVLFTVVDDREKMASLRDDLMDGLARVVKNNELPMGLEYFADFVTMWQEQKTDVIFRGAPHLLIASAPNDVVTPLQDCMIALTYFELFAQANGVGTVWDGLAKRAISDLVPGFRERLGIPGTHQIGYAIAFGKPAVRYARTTQRSPALINRVA